MAKVAAKGARFQVLTPGSSPEQWTDLGQILSTSEVKMSKNLIDVTTLDSADEYTENILGIKDGGTYSVTTLLDPDLHDNGAQTPGATFENDAVLDYRIVSTKFSPPYRVRFKGVVNEYTPIGALAPNGAIQSAFTIKINGKVTRSRGAV